MNLSEAVKHVLKHKTSSIVVDFWKDDIKNLALDVFKDVEIVIRKRPHSKKRLGLRGLHHTTIEVIHVLRTTPRRVKVGLSQFSADFLRELESLPETKDKTIFCLKVIGALTSFVLGTAYNVRRARGELPLKALRRKNTIAQFLAAEIIIKMGRLFIVRFIHEVENELVDSEESKKLRYFRQIIYESPDILPEDGADGDKAVEIVESLKNYIMRPVKS